MVKFEFKHTNDDWCEEDGSTTQQETVYTFVSKDGCTLPVLFEHFANFVRSCGYIINVSEQIDIVRQD